MRYSLLSLLLMACCHLQAATLYVDGDAGGTGDGSSWANAYTNLQDALAAAQANDELWLAEGVYYPDVGSGQINNDVASTFALSVDLTLYGGFSGYGELEETLASQRNAINYKTILSGDIDQDDDTNNSDGNFIAETSDDIAGNNAERVVLVSAITATLDSLTITGGNSDGDTAKDGGGISVESGADVTLNHVVVIGNRAGDNGGGVNAAGVGTTLTVTNSSFIGNRSNDNGGGLLIGLDATATIDNATISGNSANPNGGGIKLDNSTANVTLRHVTLVENSATNNGGGIHTGGSTFDLQYTLISGNTASSGKNWLCTSGGAFVNSGDNLVGDNGLPRVSGCSYSDSVPAQATNELYGALTDSGSATYYHPINYTSEAYNAIDSANCSLTLNTDQINQSRPASVSPHCDVGAYEIAETDSDADGVIDGIDAFPANNAAALDADADGYPDEWNDGIGEDTYNCDLACQTGSGLILDLGVIYVDADASGAADGSHWGDAYTHLQDALALAAPGHEIWIAAGTYYADEGSSQTDNDPLSVFALVSDLQIYGGFAGTETAKSERDIRANKTILSGDIDADNGGADTLNSDGYIEDEADVVGTNARRLLYAQNVTNVYVDGLALTGAKYNSTGFAGAGVYAEDSQLTLNQVAVIGNRTNANGGGIFGTGASTLITVNRSLLMNNKTFGNSHHGAGLFIRDGAAVITNSTFYGNEAGGSAGHGGAIRARYSAALTLDHVSMINNSATNTNSDGGAIFFDGVLTIGNSLVSGNSAEDLADSIYCASGFSIVDNGNNLIGSSSVSGLDGNGCTITSFPASVTPTESVGQIVASTVANNGGATDSVAIYSTGPAGDQFACSDTKDQRGFSRPYNTLCDIGAYEVQLDTDLDGLDNWSDSDDDNDGVPDTSDAFALNNAAAIDADGDGYPDEWNDGVGEDTYNCDSTCQSNSGLLLDLGVVYVDGNANGLNDGSSWQNAYVYLQDALAAVQPGHEIWLADGVYYPDEGSAPPLEFRINHSDLAIYGGFSGCGLSCGDPQSGNEETALDEKDANTYVAVLSGDIDKNDSVNANGVVTAWNHISGNNASFGLWVTSKDNLVLSDLTLSAFITTALFFDDVDNTYFYNITIRGNNSNSISGSVIDIRNSEVSFINASIINNAYTGISIDPLVKFANTNLEISSSVITGNYHLNSHPILDISSHETNIVDSEFSNNGGVAIYTNFTTLVIDRSRFLNNGNAGAIFAGGVVSTNGDLLISHSEFSGNQGSVAGAVYISDGSQKQSMAINNSSFTMNQANTGGGAIAVQAVDANNVDTVVLENVTVLGNTANQYGGGLYGEHFSGTTLFEIKNSLILDNTATTSGNNIYCENSNIDLVDGGYNLVGASSADGIAGGCSSADLDSGTSSTPTEAVAAIVESTLLDNDGPTRTLRLPDTSPAVDIIPISSCALITDQRDYARPFNSLCDVGAFEYTDLIGNGVDDGSDTDSDGLSETEEAAAGTDINDNDSDDDLILDGLEVDAGWNPLSKHTDSDGLEDGVEDANQNGLVDSGETDPNNDDSDSDGTDDGADAFALNNAADTDTDGDGKADDWLGSCNTYCQFSSGLEKDEDDDNDGLSDDYENTNGLDPLVVNPGLDFDSDGDGLTDDFETSLGTNPDLADSDSDGVDDYIEIATWCTDATSQDTDGDGMNDNMDVEPDSNATCTMPLNGLYKGVELNQGP